MVGAAIGTVGRCACSTFDREEICVQSGNLDAARSHG